MNLAGSPQGHPMKRSGCHRFFFEECMGKLEVFKRSRRLADKHAFQFAVHLLFERQIVRHGFNHERHGWQDRRRGPLRFVDGRRTWRAAPPQRCRARVSSAQRAAYVRPESRFPAGRLGRRRRPSALGQQAVPIRPPVPPTRGRRSRPVAAKFSGRSFSAWVE